MLDIIISALLGTWIIRFILNITCKDTRKDIINTMTQQNIENPSPRNVLFSKFRLVSRANRLGVATHRETGAQVHLYEESDVEEFIKKYDEFQVRLCNQRDPEDSEWNI